MKRFMVYTLGILIVYFAGYYSNPGKEEIRYQIVEVEVEREKRDIEVIEVETSTEKPDGTKVVHRETRAVDRTKIESISTRNEQEEIVRDYGKPQWSIGLYGSPNGKTIGTVDRRIFSNIHIGVYGGFNRHDYSDFEYGIGLRFEF